MSLEPSLTPLDERVLAILRAEPVGLRAVRVTEILNRRVPEWRPKTSLEDVRGILRGFEHLGRVSGRGGWWRAL